MGFCLMSARKETPNSSLSNLGVNYQSMAYYP